MYTGSFVRSAVPRGFAGLAWVSNAQVRAGDVDPPQDEARIYEIEDVVKATTVVVP